jgi:hypothetical protein
MMNANTSGSLQHNHGFRTRYISLDSNLELGHAQVREDWSLCYHESGTLERNHVEVQH